MLYNPPSGAATANDPYVGKVVQAGQQGSKVPRAAVEYPQRELVALIAEAGLAPTNADLTQVLKAVRSGQLTTFTDASNAANQVIIVPKTAHTALFKGLPFRIFPAITNTGAVAVQFGQGLSAPLKTLSGNDLAPGDLVAGKPIDIVFDGNTFLPLIPLRSEIKALIFANAPSISQTQTLWVRPDGSDNNNGLANTAQGAFATIAAAINYGLQHYFLIGAGLVIQLGIPGTYAAPGELPATSTPVTIQGDIANQIQYVIQGSGPAGGGSSVNVARYGSYTFSGVALGNLGSTNHLLTAAGGAAQVNVNNVTFTTAGNNSYALIQAANGNVTINAGCVVQGPAGYMLLASGGKITVAPAPISVLNTPNFSAATVSAINGGSVTFLSGASFTGSGASGTRYQATTNGVVNTAGGGANFIPGSTAGSTSSGGQYA